MPNKKQKIIVITGPTASGKSSLAVELALRFGGEIVNADSMQVYRGMDVGTAKLRVDERRGIRHHLIDIIDPDEDFDAAKYRSLAVPLLRDVASRGKVCFVVGGTGLYIKSLLGGLLKCPLADRALREKLRQEWEERGPGYHHQRLKRLDPESAQRIHPNDRMRILRALEVIHLTNEPLSSLIRRHAFKDRPFQALKICLQVKRERLYERINRRAVDMAKGGLVKETEDLLRKGYSPRLKPMRSLGYRQMVKFLEGALDLDEAIRQLQTDTRRYAKRQLTWLGADPEMIWIEPEDMDGIVKQIREFNGEVP